MRAGVAWLLAAAGALGACRSKAPGPAPEAIPSPSAVPWVDPARCARPCRDDETRMALVAIDDQGRLDPQGARLVDTTAQAPLAGLLAAARAAGHPTRINWAFRSHSQQEEMFLHTAEIGRVARPGHSEHELGLAVDLDYPDDAALAFLLREAPARGFVQSYPDGKQKVTGYRHEPWHFRFVGAAIAREVTAAGLSLEEFFQQHPKQGRSGRCEDCPAAASREPCRGLDARGRCEGSVLRWCFEGVATAVDCSTSERRCGWRDEATGNDCLPARGQ